jgi:hypothetical protein
LPNKPKWASDVQAIEWGHSGKDDGSQGKRFKTDTAANAPLAYSRDELSPPYQGIFPFSWKTHIFQ